MDYPIAQENYNAAGKPYWEINLLRFSTTDGDNFFFSDRRKTEIITVRSIQDGSDVSRTYKGGGHIMTLPEITRTQGLTSQQHEIVMAGASDDVLNMVFGSNMTRAAVEWHKGQMDAATGLLVATPVCELYGLVDVITDNITELGPDKRAEWTVTITVIPHHAELEYSNPAMRTYEAGLERDGDEIFLYVDSVADWNIGWGKRLHKHSDRKSSHKSDGKDKPSTPLPVPTPDGWGRN